MPQSTDKLVALCAIVALGFTGVQTYFLSQSNMISAESADAAKRSVDLASDIAQKQLRAYVLAAEGNVIGLDSGPMKVRVTVSNFGQTPASELSITMHEEWTDNFPPVPPEQRKAGDMAIKEGAKTILAPGQKVYITHDVKSPRRQELKNRTATLHAHGIITYTDIFGISHYEPFHFVQGGDKYDPNAPLMGVEN
jgi:hypothetical protein